MAMVGPPQVNRCWQDTLPRIALRYPFLMHAILSLSALHLAYTNTATKEQHSLDAVRHYDTSLKGFREAIHNIDIDNCHALFGCSTLNAICVIGLLGSHDDHTSTASRTSDFLGINYIPTIRGVKAVLHPRYQEVRTGPLGLLLSLQDWKELDPDGVPSPEAERFRNLGTIWLDSVDRHIYDEALGVLRKCQAYSFQAPSVQDDTAKRWGYKESWNRSILFIHFASEEYFTRLYQRQPHALVLFAYFAVLLHGLNGYWFFRGWGRGIVEVVDRLLGDYWWPWMEWPKYIVRI
ncbi:C6 zinc finger protein [Colletotrichum higginsianum]|uniref:Sterol uptake control protein 2 n=1 Tax=Colletotrichum higginsianum TaxID=80884 RepID=A0A4T0VHG3_9PEZI|nr:Sterol uptake control protein 2 [Colletotrichum higginsianum]GJC97823.1 C6 zinc finger protein [Colletotrichum higginsianum]